MSVNRQEGENMNEKMYIIRAHISDLPAKDQMRFNRVFKGYTKFDRRIGLEGKEYKQPGLIEKANMWEWLDSGMFFVMCDDMLMQAMKEIIIGFQVKADVYEVKQHVEW